MTIDNSKTNIDDVLIITLESEKKYENPFRDIQVSAVFTGPANESEIPFSSNETIEIPAQFKEDKWTIQFKPYIAGKWAFLTKCTDTLNTSLHSISGEFDVAPERERKVFAAADYGAFPDSVENSRDAIQNAIDATSSYTNETGLYAEVQLEKSAVYRIGIAEGNDGIHALNIKNARNIKFDGQGSELVFTNPAANGFAVSGSENIVICNFKIDYDPLPYATGYIVDIDYEKSTFDLKINEDSPELDLPAFATARGNGGLTKRFEGGSYKYGPVIVTGTVFNKIGPRLWRIVAGSGPFNGYSDPIKALKIGDRYSHLAATWGSAVGIDHSNNVRCEGVTLYSSPGLAFFNLVVENMTFRNCHVKPKNENRGISTGADGMHLRSLRGCLVIDGCTFEAMPDDGINIHSSALVITKVLSKRVVEVSKHTFDIRKGDRLVVMNTATGIPRAEVITTDVEDCGGSFRITLDRDVEGIVTKSDDDAPDKLYNLDSCGTSFVIRRNVFNSHRCRDVLLSTQFGIVEDNIFNTEGGWSIVLFHETYWWNEGPIASDVKIRNNIFNGRSGSGIPSIYSYLQMPAGKPETKGREFRNLQIRDNIFNNTGRAIELFSAYNVEITGNIVNNPDIMNCYGDDYSTIFLKNCDKINIDGLDVFDENKNMASIVKIADNCEAGQGSISMMNIRQKGRPAKKVVFGDG
ncbi:MAG: DUF5060 domain-containing protein [Saccharofermentanales bacterium]